MSIKVHHLTLWLCREGAAFVRQNLVMKLVEATRLFGGTGGNSFDDGVHTTIRKLVIYSSEVIESVQIEYDYDGQSKWSDTHGRKEGQKNTVVLDYPSEFLVSVSGYIAEYHSLLVINSLTLRSNKKTYGPFGTQRGDFFKIPPTTGNKIVGFHGSAGYHLDSIGAHFEPPTPHLSRKLMTTTVEPSSKVITTVGPFGSEDGDAWDDGVHNSVKQLIVYSNEVINSIQIEYEDNGQFKLANTHGSNQGTKSTVDLDYPSEFLISVSGYMGEVVIYSLTFETNKKTFGPFGNKDEKKGQHFKFPSTDGYKIVGFLGRSGSLLDAIGAYLEPRWIPIGPFGGQGGAPFDDGTHTTIRQLIIFYSEAISSIEVEYDDDGKSNWSNTRGLKRGTRRTVELDYPDEYINSVSGYIDSVASVKLVVSLTIDTNMRRYGPFGTEQGEHFKFPSKDAKIVGFQGRCGGHVDAIGAYYEP
ncbi:hypothetical protein LguiB_004604 [Lonicera macranthoides]